MISRKLYLKISKYTLVILNRYSKSIVIQSITELHLVRPHPVFLKNYTIFSSNFFYTKLSIIFLKNFLIIFSKIILGIFKKKYAAKYLNKKARYIFFSHLLNKKDASKKSSKDHYFSHIFSNLSNNYQVILMNHTNENFPSVKNKMILDKNLDLLSEIVMLYKIFCQSIKFFKNFLLTKDMFRKKFFFFLCVMCFSNKTLENLRIYFQSLKIINNMNIKKVIVTYEGHAFERNIFSATNLSNKDIEKVAFHHSLPFKFQTAYTHFIKNYSNPDVVLTSGKASNNNLLKKLNSKISISLVGSNRLSKKILKKKKIIENKCLVIPEGIESEVEKLLLFCKNYLQKYNNCKFIIRLHPLSRNKIKKYIDIFPNDYFIKGRVIFSNNEFASEDMKISKFCLYRGSSLCIEAANHNIIPIYLSTIGEMDFNPLNIIKEKNFFFKVKDLNSFNKLILSNPKIKNLDIVKNLFYSLPKKNIIKKFFKDEL
jgi:hypothetical protein